MKNTQDPVVATIAMAAAVAETILRDLILPTVCLAITLASYLVGWAPTPKPALPPAPVPTALLAEPVAIARPTPLLPPARQPLALLSPVPAPSLQLETMKVIELRKLARERGFKQLARSGRKKDLIEALQN